MRSYSSVVCNLPKEPALPAAEAASPSVPLPSTFEHNLVSEVSLPSPVPLAVTQQVRDKRKENYNHTIFVYPKSAAETPENLRASARKVLRSCEPPPSILSTKDIQSGGLIITCRSKSDILKVKASLDSHDSFKTIVPLINKKLFIVFGVPVDVSDDEFIHDFEAAFPDNFSGHFRIKKSYNCSDTASKNIILEASPEVSPMIQKRRRVCIQLCNCLVKEYHRVKRCFHCQRIGHLQFRCKETPRCSRCSEEHVNECSNEPKIPQEKQNLLVPEFDEDDDEDKIAATYGMGNRGASLWTLVGGKLNTRFSVSNQNLDTVTLESGSNNWKVSNPSLVNLPDENSINMGNPQAGAQQAATSKLLPRTSSDTSAIKKAIKKFPMKRPHLRRKGHNHPQNRWVAFHATPGREEDHEVLSLYKGEKPPSDLLGTVPTQRRQSFDERSLAALRDKASSRFQSLPDVKKFALEKGADAIEWDDLVAEDQENLSTANLLLAHDGGEDSIDENYGNVIEPPKLTFTRASLTPCPSSEESLEHFGENLGLQQASSLTSIHELQDLGSDAKSSGKK
ncbi:unnamed protein product [Larinioides sclopetarius]|uniref:CCHC-type domain-containing protein n=1 Tax=Larinioides sclopetarius TaxID=280406 RepID=A0AAV2AJP7_9ARAC